MVNFYNIEIDTQEELSQNDRAELEQLIIDFLVPDTTARVEILHIGENNESS